MKTEHKVISPTGSLHVITYGDGTFRLSAEGNCENLLDALAIAGQEAADRLAARLGATACPVHTSPSAKTRARAK
jgi:hypothetical protein